MKIRGKELKRQAGSFSCPQIAGILVVVKSG
jgi:hypothetical protein